MLKYVLKRLVLMLFTLFIIITMTFILVHMLPREMPQEKNLQEIIRARWEALGYNKPVLTQYGIYLRNIFTKWDFGTSWYISPRKGAWEVLSNGFLPTLLVNLYAMILAVPIGLALGVYAAIRKNKWDDSLISTLVMVFISVPSYVYAFLVQYFLYFKLGWLPLQMYALADAGGSYFTWKMFTSMIPPVLALSFGSIAHYTRFVRAELTESLTSEYMLLARTKGLTRAQATRRHALKNAMVPVLPSILSEFIGLLSGSLIIEQIFSIPGVGQLYIKSLNLFDYDVFMIDCVFYTFIYLLAGIVLDLSYGFIDPRIRMGER
ncbi:MAG: ABC transporter permease [Clostridia bacterium]|nr:ABC transporter permease [Clostridia bacterium]